MSFSKPPEEKIRDLLRSARTIAVCGLSSRPIRPSYGVSVAMRRFGYQIIPVNPRLDSWLDVPAVASLDEAVAAAGNNQGIDIVNVFRRSAHVDSLVDDCIRLGLPALWLQLGVIDETAALRAQRAGITVVMDRCIRVDRAAMEA